MIFFFAVSHATGLEAIHKLSTMAESGQVAVPSPQSDAVAATQNDNPNAQVNQIQLKHIDFLPINSS